MDLMGMPQQQQQPKQQQQAAEVETANSVPQTASSNPPPNPVPSADPVSVAGAKVPEATTMGEPNPVPLSQMLAAAMNSATPSAAPSKSSTAATPSWRLDLMMEKLRQKRAVLKPLQETAKNLRQALVERRCFLDTSDKLHLQKCLDTLQQSIKVNSLSSMVERLDMVSRQLGLKLSPGANEQEWFISSDMFYLEVLIDATGVVKDMKIQHEGKTEQLQCPDLIKSLEVQDFKDFAAHLQGLISIYSLNADKIIKSKAFIALQAMETDLAAMASTYSHETKADQVIMKHLLGHFQPRRGGHPVKLTYYISPYEFFDKETKTCIPNDISEIIVKRQIGTWATVSIQSSPGIHRKLQMSTNVTVYRNPEGKAMPRYGTLNSTNSTALPACFVLKLAKPIPIFKGLLNSIQKITGIENTFSGEPQPILSLITQVLSENQLDCSEEKGLFVTLPDQHHCYFMTETSGLEGVLVSSISFTLASQLPQVIVILRQQLMFNTLVGSCVRLCSKPENESIVFELSALSHHNLSVSFQHPLDDSLVTLEFDIRDVMLPSCRVHALYSTTPDMIPTLEEHACTVVRRSMSIPVTVRAVIRRWQSMKVKTDIPKPDSLIPAPSTGNTGSINPLLPVSAPSCGLESQQMHQQPSFKQNMNYNAPAQTTNIDLFSLMTNPIFSSLHQNIQSTKNGQGQLGAVGPGGPLGSSVLQGLLDHNNPAKRRKRNKTSTEIQKSPLRQKSPIRSDEHGGTTWMAELGLETECRWNIDITPVGNSTTPTEELKRKFPVKRSVSLDSNVESDDRMPSLSITPVNASGVTGAATSTVNSLLASIRPGIEIIPLPNPQNPPNIPNSITVTPILGNSPDLKKLKKRPEDSLLERKKIKKLDVKQVNKLQQQQGGKPSVSTMKSVSTLPKPKKLTKPTLDITKKIDPKMEKDKSLVIYQPPKTQAATQAVAAALAAANKNPVKKGSLDSVINKLKLQSAQASSVDGDNSSMKKAEQMSTKDLLKASSSITDIIQKNQSKGLNEYSVKSSSGLVPGGGLKLTINKSLTAPKFDVRKKSVLKRPLGQKLKPPTGQLKDEPKRPLVKKEELNKIADTSKLYMPSLERGALFKDTKFDLKNFQIPKKSKPIEKAETASVAPPTPPVSISEKSNPELTVEPINPNPPSLTPIPLPTQVPPRQSTPQPVLPVPTSAAPTAPLVPPLIPVAPPPISTPSIPPPAAVPEMTSNTKQEEAKPVEPAPAEIPVSVPPPTLPPPPQLLPLVMPPKETIISPESPEPMETAPEANVAPQNIPTTPPTALDEPQPEKPVESEPVVAPPRATTPAPSSTSTVPPVPPRATTPSSVTTPSSNGSTTSQTAPPPASTTPTADKLSPSAEETPAVPPPPPPPVSDSSPVVSMHCIVKSPAPNSPMLLRSPALIVQSPHTPFTIDDDLMDEALIGGAPTNPDKTT